MQHGRARRQQEPPVCVDRQILEITLEELRRAGGLPHGGGGGLDAGRGQRGEHECGEKADTHA